jgi:hypothetical protein
MDGDTRITEVIMAGDGATPIITEVITHGMTHVVIVTDIMSTTHITQPTPIMVPGDPYTAQTEGQETQMHGARQLLPAVH